MNGIIPLWKEKGMTSHDCVFKMRKILKTKKVGHAGTLDPNVEGVLPICIGRGTKLVDLLHEQDKTYFGEITLGKSTTTEDSDGEIVEQKAVVPFTEQEIDETMKTMIGDIVQIPPMYSAVKVNGKKLYEYAREGLEVERPARQVNIKSFERVSPLKYDDENKTQSFKFVVTCTKGTYVRTLAVDLGKKLNYPSYMSSLTRLSSGGYGAKDAFKLDDIQKKVDAGQLSDILLPLETVTNHLPQYQMNEEIYHKVKNGVRLKKTQVDHFNGPYLAMYYQNRLIAIYEPYGIQLKLWKMIEVN